MERRKFVVGLGALAAGSSAAVGTGAFTAMNAPREAQIDVVDDTQGLIGLEAGTDSDAIDVEDDELSIDLGAYGINKNSVYVFGDFGSSLSGFDDVEVDDSSDIIMGGRRVPGGQSTFGGEVAFSVENNDGTDYDVDVSYAADADDLGGAQIGFRAEVGEDPPGETDSFIIGPGETDGTLNVNVPAGQNARVGFAISTVNVGDVTESDLSGTVTVSASNPD